MDIMLSKKCKRKRAKDIPLQMVSKYEREAYFKNLQAQGWEQIEMPFEFERKGTAEKIRMCAREHAAKIGADLLVEVEDERYSTNPYNNFVYYAWKQKGVVQGAISVTPPPPRPSIPPARAPVLTPGPPKPVLHTPMQHPLQQAVSPEVQMQAPTLSLRRSYTTHEDALNDCLEKLAILLAREDKPIRFVDTRELLHPKVTIRKRAYKHIGERSMDLILTQESVNEYSLIGNEAHSVEGGKTAILRDNLISIKTLGVPSYAPLEDFQKLEREQKAAIAKSLFMFLERYIPVV
jgi:hypothetical protein